MAPAPSSAHDLLSRLRSLAAEPRDAASLAAFRCLFGLVMAWGGTRYLAGDWLKILFTGPEFHFRYPGLSWVPELSAAGLSAVIGALVLSSLGVAVGLFYRASAIVMFLTFTYLEVLDVTNYLNHHYLAGLFSLLFIFVPAHATLSLDSVRRARQGRPLPRDVPFLWVLLLRFQLSVVYFYAGLAKFGGDWLLHGQPLQLWLAPLVDVPVLGRFLALPAAPLVLSWCGFLYDTCIWLFLWQKRTRRFAYGVVIVFHTLTRVFFDIGLFPWIMTTATLVFFETDWPRRWLPHGLSARPVPSAPSPPQPSRLTLWVCGVYALLQLSIPLRHYLSPSDVLWAEDGMRFSWKVMIREKSASVDFVLRGQKTGKTRRISPFKFITPRQYREMGGQPDLIVQLAHHVSKQVSARWGEPVSVFAEALVSLNGRPAAPLLDPRCDLTLVDPTASSLTCTLPHPGGPPPELRARNHAPPER